jgi:thiamine-phosphate pyrophosphorylase
MIDFPLTAILDADAAAGAGWGLLDLTCAFLAGGARLLQLRVKHAPGAVFLETASAVVRLAHAAGATVIVNDRADLARLAGADGVHLGQDDLAPAAARLILGPDAIVGLSTHTAEQVTAACAAPVTYVAIGPVFDTMTKATGHRAIGIDGVRAAARETTRCGLPLVAIGGMTLERAADVRRAGAASVAVIGDLLRSGDPERRVRQFLERLNEADPGR